MEGLPFWSTKVLADHVYDIKKEISEQLSEALPYRTNFELKNRKTVQFEPSQEL